MKIVMMILVTAIPVIGFASSEFGYYRSWNDASLKSINSASKINPASKKKEADDWKPPRKLTADEIVKWLQIMRERFGEPAYSRDRVDGDDFVDVWRFEGDEWLSVGIYATSNWVTNHWEYELSMGHWE